MFRTGIFSFLGLAAALFITPAEAGAQQPHPVFAWKGNEYLFEVRAGGDSIQLTGYRAIGSKWQLVGTTRIADGQRAPAHGFLQRIWFEGRKIGTVVADLSDPWWRYYPAEDKEPD